MSKIIEVEKDFFVGNDYWQYKAAVRLENGEVYDTDIIWARGRDNDDRDLPITDFIEEVIKTRAEAYANEQLSDIFSYHNAYNVADRED